MLKIEKKIKGNRQKIKKSGSRATLDKYSKRKYKRNVILYSKSIEKRDKLFEVVASIKYKISSSICFICILS